MSSNVVETSVFISNQEYRAVLYAGEVISLKRFNREFDMWVELQFLSDESNAIGTLLEFLSEEYICQLY